MVDNVSKEIRSKTMRSVKSKFTKIDNDFVCKLKRNKVEFKRYAIKLYGKPDIVIKKHKIVIFIDSCFWHGCPYHHRRPKSNRKYWNQKIARNKTRDKNVNMYYRNSGWTVIRFWEHSINKNIDKCIDKVLRITSA